MAVKKLIEVALPLDAINAASAKEKSIRHGHPSTLHLWWARRPLAAARAVIWASLVDDPSSHPDVFPTEKEQNRERKRLFRILEDLVVWDNSNSEEILNAARNEIQKCMGDDTISLLDPFAGGGAIPLEAQRLGLCAYAQDLNPVAVTINKAMIEIPPRFQGRAAVNPEAQARKDISSWEGNAGLAEDIAYYGRWIRNEAERRIGHMYPKVKLMANQGGGEASVISWIWSRTIKCPNPACGCKTPLIKSFDLSRKRGQEWHVEPTLEDGKLGFSVAEGRALRDGTISRHGAVCINCGSRIDYSYIRVEALSGRMGRELVATVADSHSRRVFVSPDETQRDAARCVRPTFAPTCELVGKAKVNVGNYGFTTTSDLFTNRQLTALLTFCELVNDAKAQIERDAIAAGLVEGTPLAEQGNGARAYAEAVGTYLAIGVDRMADINNSMCSWKPTATQSIHVFTRQAIPMIWDYVENNVFNNSAGDYNVGLNTICKVLLRLPISKAGFVDSFDAQSDNGMRGVMVSTDPPYYDNIDYADLSDFFYAWLRQTMRETYPQLFNTISTPKAEELIASAFRDYGVLDARSHFEEGMLEAFHQIYKSAREDVPVTVYYAFKQTSTETSNNVERVASTGWETMLAAIIKAGFSVVGTWPVRTEMSTRSIASGSNALASSIVLVCRKRPEDAPMATRRDFVNGLKRELKPALGKLQASNIAPVDLAQSAIGPGIGVYSRFSKVLEADGAEMTVRSALQIINQELDLYFSDQDNDLDRESRFSVDLYTQYAFNEIRFGEADVLARAKNTSIEGIAAKGAIKSAKGVVRLLGRDEIRDMPSPDFCWLFTQQLTRSMETGGIEDCAKMLKDVFDSRAENAKALAYRLFTIADKKGWAQEAFAYNSLVVAWPDIQTRAAQMQQETPVQTSLDI